MKSIWFFSILLSFSIMMSLDGYSKVINLKNHHICPKTISYDENITVPQTKLERHDVTYWCFKVPPICTKKITKLVKVNETITVTKSKLAVDCCEGYKRGLKTCVPVCSLGCNNGDCVEPETCVCNEGWMGRDCLKQCVNNTHGLDCSGNCLCENGGWCEKETGFCICPEGYTGDRCELGCPEGYYGMSCEYECECENDAICMVENGYCMCQPGYYGNYCEHKCEPGFHGADCANICECETDTTEICHHEDGECICKPGYTGEFCQNECTDMTYGDGCSEECKCENAQFCEPSNGTCLCDVGWIGEKCSEKCPEGYFGEDCKYKCLMCNNVKQFCNHVTGSCDCFPGYFGSSCEIPCPENFWGSNCNNFCNCSLNATCDSKTGHCKCKDGWIGESCSIPCSSNSWGPNCNNPCNCSENEMCDTDDGKCICKAGWIGNNCSTPCPKGMYGVYCKYECVCPLGDTCHANNGSCIVAVVKLVFNPVYLLVPFCILTIAGVVLYVCLCPPLYLRKLHYGKRSISNQTLEESEENIAVHFKNPLYNEAELPKEAISDAADVKKPDRRIFFVDIMSSIRASRKGRTSVGQPELHSDTVLKRSSKISNLSADGASSKVDNQPDNIYSISDDLDDDLVPEQLDDFNTSEIITGEKNQQDTNSAKNK